MSASRYIQAYGDEWFIVPKKTGIDIACCECSLVHDLRARLHNGHIEVKFMPHARKTSALRRSEGKK